MTDPAAVLADCWLADWLADDDGTYVPGDTYCRWCMADKSDGHNKDCPIPALSQQTARLEALENIVAAQKRLLMAYRIGNQKMGAEAAEQLTKAEAALAAKETT